MVRKILQPFYTAYASSSFVISLFLAFPFILLVGLFDNTKARRAIWTLLQWMAYYWLFIIGMPVTKKGPRPDKNKKYVYIANHISYIDTVVIFPAIPSYFRPLGKIEMKRIPLFGFIYKQIVLLVDRSSTHSRAKSMRLMWRALRYGNIAIFPEGTFNETEPYLKDFYDGAFRLAVNAQTPILPMIFADTVDRWHYSAWWKIWPGRNRVIYLDPVPVAGLKAEDIPALKEKVHALMTEAMKNAKATA